MRILLIYTLQELKAKDIPRVAKDGVTAYVIAGRALDTDSPVYTRTPTHYIHYQLEPGAKVQHEIPSGWTAFLYTLEGQNAFYSAIDQCSSATTGIRLSTT